MKAKESVILYIWYKKEGSDFGYSTNLYREEGAKSSAECQPLKQNAYYVLEFGCAFAGSNNETRINMFTY